LDKRKKITISLVILSLFLVMVGNAFANGSLEVNAPDESSVYVESVYKGNTPLTVNDLSAGSHYLNIGNLASPGSSWWGNVNVTDGVTTVFNVPYVTFDTTSDPSEAIVCVRDTGACVGTTSKLINWYVPDNNLYVWTLIFQKYGYFTNTSYHPLSAGATKAYNAVMKRVDSTGAFWLTTSPGSTTWKLTKPGHATYQGTTNAGGTGGNNLVDLGTYTLTVSRTGFVTSVSTIDIASPNGMNANWQIVYNYTTANVALVQTGSLSVTSSPTGAQIYVDNVFKGTTPRTVTNLAPGERAVRLVKTGYQDYNTLVTVNSGQTTTLSATLTPQ